MRVGGIVVKGVPFSLIILAPGRGGDIGREGAPPAEEVEEGANDQQVGCEPLHAGPPPRARCLPIDVVLGVAGQGEVVVLFGQLLVVAPPTPGPRSSHRVACCRDASSQDGPTRGESSGVNCWSLDATLASRLAHSEPNLFDEFIGRAATWPLEPSQEGVIDEKMAL